MPRSSDGPLKQLAAHEARYRAIELMVESYAPSIVSSTIAREFPSLSAAERRLAITQATQAFLAAPDLINGPHLSGDFVPGAERAPHIPGLDAGARYQLEIGFIDPVTGRETARWAVLDVGYLYSIDDLNRLVREEFADIFSANSVPNRTGVDAATITVLQIRSIERGV